MLFAVRMTLAEKQQELVAQLARCHGTPERLAWLVARARQQRPLEAEFKTEAFRVEGCLAKLWLVAEGREGRCCFRCDSDSQVVKAVAGLLCEFYSGQAPAEVLAHDPAFLAAAGITQHLTPNRRNALARVWEKIRAFAEAYRDAGIPHPASGIPHPPLCP